MTADDVAQAKRAAREVSMRACRAMERALKAALAGGRLYGLPDLGGGVKQLLAARVHRVKKTGNGHLSRKPLPKTEGKWWLCISALGDLVMVRVVLVDNVWELHTRAPLDDIIDFHAEDAGDMAMVIGQIMPLHVEAAAKAKERYEGLSRLAGRLELALRAHEIEMEDLERDRGRSDAPR